METQQSTLRKLMILPLSSQKTNYYLGIDTSKLRAMMIDLEYAFL
jgi:hypothetical protein